MQFTTVRSKEKDYNIYLKSEKLVHSKQEHEVSQLFGSGKNWLIAISSLTNTAAIGDKKMQFTTVRSEKLVHSNQEHEKNVSQLFGRAKNWFLAILSRAIWREKKMDPAIWRPKKVIHKHCCSYLEREKSDYLLFGDQKMQFTTVRSKEKDYDIYLKSEKLVHSNQEHEKMFPSYLEVVKTGSQLFRA